MNKKKKTTHKLAEGIQSQILKVYCFEKYTSWLKSRGEREIPIHPQISAVWGAFLMCDIGASSLCRAACNKSQAGLKSLSIDGISKFCRINIDILLCTERILWIITMEINKVIYIFADNFLERYFYSYAYIITILPINPFLQKVLNLLNSVRGILKGR